MNKLVLAADEEIRVELIRIYPDQEAHRKLPVLKEEVRRVTNHIVRSREDVKNARRAYVIRHGLVGPPPVMPQKPQLPTPVTNEDKQAVKQAWRDHKRACKEMGPAWVKWYQEVAKAVKDLPELEWRKDSYQRLRSLYGNQGAAVLHRDTVKRVSKTKGANYKRANDHVPLVWGNAPLVETGAYYGERRGAPWYNARIKVNGMVILGRLRRPLPGKQVQGVTLSQKADGWYAAVKCIVPKRSVPAATLPPVGVDVGQTDIVALSDGYRKRNPRDAALKIAKAALQQVADLSRCQDQIRIARQKIARIDQHFKRGIDHWLHSELLPRLAQHEYVFVEKLQKNFKSDNGPLSCMHQLLDALKLHLGDRVREVDCAYTSQTCSQCGNVDKSSRDRKTYTCSAPGCEHVQDADTNAARNILSKGLKSLSS